jgi:hypothetical protein
MNLNKSMTGRTSAVGLLCALGWIASAWADGGCLEIHQGYFWDPVKQDYFIPRGIAYQLWNPPVGANQSFEQLHYDLVEFKKMYANSVRCELVWGEVQTAPGDQGHYWEKADYLMDEAERLGLKLFILIGFQYPPAWFPKEWRGINSSGLTPEVMKCLATNTPSTALDCLSPGARDCLLTNNLSADELSKVLSCLVAGAQAGAVSNVLSCLQTNVRSDLLPKVLSGLISDVINYEHPQAREAYAKHIAAVTGRYKARRAIGGWILGNEYAYFDLWEDPLVYLTHRFIGFDAYSQASYRQYLASVYGGDIAALNARWGTNYASFDAVVMAPQYPDNRVNPGYHDLIQWRKKSIGDFVALGAVAARDADTNHLRTYSMVGGIFNGRDANNACEDARTIVARCEAAGARLNFWAINNYANAAIGSELRSADFGIGKYQEESGLPVMISETGHSSTEDLFDYPDAGRRQAKAAPGQLWESLVSGAIGTHVFHWNDRGQFVRGYFLRERGFGIVEQTRKIKEPVFSNAQELFRRMQNLQIEKLLGGTVNPAPDVQIFWSTNTDMGWPRANQENAMMWGALKRLGYQPDIIADRAFESGAYSNAPVLLLSRCYQMSPLHLEMIGSRVIPAGIHVHADADLPGQFDAYHLANPNWATLMDSIFGLDVTRAKPALDDLVTDDSGYSDLRLRGLSSLGPVLTPTYSGFAVTWKIWHDIGVTSGRTIVTDTGYLNSQTGTPALVIKTNATGRGRSAINTFALGDTYLDPGSPHAPLWDFRSDWLRAIYRTHFGVTPAIDLSGPGAQYVLPDYRTCTNGSVLLSLLNEHTNVASVTLSAPCLITGMTVENLTRGGILQTNSDGVLHINLEGDDYVLLYAYPSANGYDESLVNPSPYKIWLESAPTAVWPKGSGYDVTVGYDTPGGDLDLFVSFERVGSANKTYGQATAEFVAGGRGTNTLSVPIPDADLNDPDYVSTPNGGEYVFHAWLERDGARLSDSYLPVRLLWGVRPVTPLPATLVPGNTYPITVEWQELPSYLPDDPTPLDRATLWDSATALQQRYAVVLELKSNGQVVTSDTNLTWRGTGNHEFSITVPPGAGGPFTWAAYLRTATNVWSLDVNESFEGRDRGAVWPDHLDLTFTDPWHSFTYAWPNPDQISLWQNQGVQLTGSHGSQSAFIVITNPPNQVVSTFGFSYVFPQVWSLPSDPRQWTNFVFGYDFKENHSYDCFMEMQIKNDDPSGIGKWIQFTNHQYHPGPDGWDTVRATLDQFVPPGLAGVFEPDKVHAIVLNVRMVTNPAQYVASFDNILFDGPDINAGGGVQTAIFSSENDVFGVLQLSSQGNGLILSWTGTGTLQSATDVGGQWENLLNATNPQPIAATNEHRFYRLHQ